MLQVKSGWLSPSAPILTLDFYVPVKVSYKSQFREIPDYWRTGSMHATFLEIGILRSSGQVVAFTLVSMDAWGDLHEPPPPTPCQSGVPVVDTSALRGQITDAWAPIALRLGTDFLVIDLVPGATVVRELQDHGLRFLIGEDGTWVSVVVPGCDAHEMGEVRAGIRHVQKPQS